VQWEEGSGRILLGVNTGRAALMLRPITFQLAGVWISNGLPCTSIYACPVRILHSDLRKIRFAPGLTERIYCVSRWVSILLIPSGHLLYRPQRISKPGLNYRRTHLHSKNFRLMKHLQRSHSLRTRSSCYFYCCTVHFDDSITFRHQLTHLYIYYQSLKHFVRLIAPTCFDTQRVIIRELYFPG
jgi:hypothetical protein